MDDMKDKFKGFMKKVSSSTSSSSSSKFKGQGRVLGSSSSSSQNHPLTSHQSQTQKPQQPSNPNPPKTPSLDPPNPNPTRIPTPNTESSKGFDPFDSLITSSKTSQNGVSLNVFECPVCQTPFMSEELVSAHVEQCLSNENGDLENVVRAYLAGNPSKDSVDIVLRLLRNVVREPENGKFRKVRLGNPKIAKAVGEAVGGVELLEFVGFELREEGGDMCAVMDVPIEERVGVIGRVVELLDGPRKVEEVRKKVEDLQPGGSSEERVERPTKVDRQTKVFFSVSENVAAKIELPDSFYNRSAEELKREAEMRKKKIAESQLLIPKSYKEKQAKAARKRYTKTLIRIQFPDGVVLQGVFSPIESTTALYEFVSSALKQPNLEFELLDPVLVKRRVIPRFPQPGKRVSTLEEEDLVPSALIKFKPIESDSVVYTGLSNELLEISEPLLS